MKIVKSNLPAKAVADRIQLLLEERIAYGDSITWLLAGGSAIDYYRNLASFVTKDIDFSRLTISLGDERYSPDRFHRDATMPTFMKLELFKKLKEKGAKFFDILTGDSLDHDANRFDSFLQEALNKHNFILSNQGIGADGHTAGIIPNSDQKLFKSIYESGSLAVGHRYGGLHPERITITPKMIKSANMITVYAVGEEKKQILRRLSELSKLKDLENYYHLYPSLYTIINSTEFYTDQEIS